VYACSQYGYIYALNSATGNLIWSYTTGGAVDSTPAIGLGGVVYVGSNDNNIYALDGATGRLKWL
jgi:outer membrane protein assembly factor BamB